MASDRTGISWTATTSPDGTVTPGSTWNPVAGCSRVSDGCRYCYAEALSLRFGWSKTPWTAPNAAENVVLHPERLEQPLRWRKPRRIFVNSMSDLFHERVPDTYIAAVFGVMAATPRHTYQILTKRPERMRAWFATVEAWAERSREVFADDPLAWRRWNLLQSQLTNRLGSGAHSAAFSGPWPWPLPNVWLGVSIEQDRWCGRADLLRDTLAAVRFISAEPLLEPLTSLNLTGIDWLIVGGESGPGPDERKLMELCDHWPTRVWSPNCPRCHGANWVPKGWALEEARRLQFRCAGMGVPFFFKQWGGARPDSHGHLLDGVEYHEFPTPEGRRA